MILYRDIGIRHLNTDMLMWCWKVQVYWNFCQFLVSPLSNRVPSSYRGTFTGMDIDCALP